MLILILAWIFALIGQFDDQIGNLITATVAAASIVYSVSRAQQASKDQYTFNLLANRFENASYETNVSLLSEYRRQKIVDHETTLDDLLGIKTLSSDWIAKPKPPYYALVPVLNFWEHVCTAYVDDRINRKILEDSVQDLIRDLVARYGLIIGDMRGEDDENLEHLCCVWFVVASQAERALTTPKLGPVPKRLSPDDQWRWKKWAKAKKRAQP
ncbi:MAG: hypothetical protein R3E02_04575 [Blastomonas sp.]